jgi:hypothetical protein
MDDLSPLSPSKAVVLGVVLTIIYIPILVKIWKNRNVQCVLFNSPKLILCGGIALYLDSICNVLI